MKNSLDELFLKNSLVINHRAIFEVIPSFFTLRWLLLVYNKMTPSRIIGKGEYAPVDIQHFNPRPDTVFRHLSDRGVRPPLAFPNEAS